MWKILDERGEKGLVGFELGLALGEPPELLLQGPGLRGDFQRPGSRGEKEGNEDARSHKESEKKRRQGAHG